MKLNSSSVEESFVKMEQVRESNTQKQNKSEINLIQILQAIDFSLNPSAAQDLRRQVCGLT